MALFKVGDKVRWNADTGSGFVLEILEVSSHFYKSRWVIHADVREVDNRTVHSTEIWELERLYRLVTPLEQLL